jgi:hypothetical protein
MKQEYRNEEGYVVHTDKSVEHIVELVGDFDLLIIRLTQARVIVLEKLNLRIDVDARSSYSEYEDQEDECRMNGKQHDIASTSFPPDTL